MNKILTAGAVLAGAVALTGGGLGIASAAGAIPSGTIHGCVTGTARTLEHVYTSATSGTTCSSGFQVIWPNGAALAGPVRSTPTPSAPSR